jgi:hypothetical protein
MNYELSQFLNSRQRRRAEARLHNDIRDANKALTVPIAPAVVEPPESSAARPIVAKEKRTPLPGAVQLMFALIAKTMSVPNRFRGYLPSFASPRARARAAGFNNVRHMQAEQRLAEHNRKAAEEKLAAELEQRAAAADQVSGQIFDDVQPA